MTKKTFFSNWSMLKSENAALKIVLLALCVALIISVMTIANLSNKRTVVVIPPNFSKKFEVKGNEISQGWFEDTGFFLSDRILSVCPENAQMSFDSVMPYFSTDPEDVKVIREKFALQAQTIKENDLYQVFYPMRVSVSPKGMNFTVEGILKKMSGNNPVSTGRATVTYGFIVKDGRVIIKNVEVK